jgi:hypothetical protein
MGRLRALEHLGLAEETAPGTWRIAGDIEPTLRRMGERGDIIKTMHRDLKDAGLNRAAADQAIFDPKANGRIVGRLVAEGFSDELRERRYAIVDGIDGRTHYVDLGLRRGDDEPLVRNTIVELRARETSPRQADRTIAEIASRNQGSIARIFIATPIRAPRLNLFKVTLAGSKQCEGRAWPSGCRTDDGMSGKVISTGQSASRRRAVQNAPCE